LPEIAIDEVLTKSHGEHDDRHHRH
jgi:hypothetical protein